MQAQIVIRELSEIAENKSTNGGGDDDDVDIEVNTSDAQQSKESLENKTVEVI